jgi:hypothetical protein
MIFSGCRELGAIAAKGPDAKWPEPVVTMGVYLASNFAHCLRRGNGEQ